MKTILTILGDTFVAAVLLIGGFGLHSLVGAPSWLMVVSVLPFLVYLHFRHGVGFRFILWFLVLFAGVSFGFAHFLPDQYRAYSGGFVVVLLSPLATSFQRKPQTGHGPVP